MNILRSMLFVPGDSEKKMAKAASVGADALILDLEDSVAAQRRPLAREMTLAIFFSLSPGTNSMDRRIFI